MREHGVKTRYNSREEDEKIIITLSKLMTKIDILEEKFDNHIHRDPYEDRYVEKPSILKLESLVEVIKRR
jgi:hypothetical protein